MLTNDVIEYMMYKGALKGNYRKGVHTMRNILENPKQAADFAGSLGGVSVVFGVPLDKPDRNSADLLELVQHSSVIDQASLTWLSQWWPEEGDSYDMLCADVERCTTVANTELMWRAAGFSPVGAGKIIAVLAGLDSNEFADINAVASSAIAMSAVASSAIAMSAVASSAIAMSAVASSAIAMSAVASNYEGWAACITSQTAMTAIRGNVSASDIFDGANTITVGKGVVKLAGLNPANFADMDAVVASELAMDAVVASELAMDAVVASELAMDAVVASELAMDAVVASELAMDAVVASELAMDAVVASELAMDAVVASGVAIAAVYGTPNAYAKWKGSAYAVAAMAAAGSVAVGKAACILAGLDPAGYADMTAVAASSTAMTAVAASSTAMTAVAASSTAMTAVAASSTAMTAVAAAWAKTESVIVGSTVAMNALKNSGKCETITKNVSGAKSVTFYTGLCFVFTAQIATDGGACYIKAARPSGTETVTLCSAKTTATCNKFCKDPYVQCTNSGHTYDNNKLYCYKIG